jgi:hypothetical protein
MVRAQHRHPVANHRSHRRQGGDGARTSTRHARDLAGCCRNWLAERRTWFERGFKDVDVCLFAHVADTLNTRG